MKIIITGGAGFIGSHLVEKLIKKRHKVIIIDNFSTGRQSNINTFKHKIKIVRADISKKGQWSKHFANVQVVYHLAALADIVPSIQNPDKYFAANVTGTKNILNACISNKVPRIIYSASSSCYGIPKKYPTSESEKIDPRYPYALTKRIGEELILHYSRIYNMNALSLRLFNVYGTRSRTSGTYGAVFGVFLKQKIESKPLTVVGDGNQKRDFTYVSDIVEAFYRCLFYKGKINIFNIGTGKPQSVNKIVRILNCKKIKIPKRPGEPEITHANIKLVKKELNWSAKITIDKGIGLILKELQYWKKAPLWTPSKIKKATVEWFKHIK
jgi:UDP-glucose 4-epimerase